jgi:hypothetical protein
MALLTLSLKAGQITDLLKIKSFEFSEVISLLVNSVKTE